MDVGYFVTPFVTWFIAGSTKFIVNSIRSRELAFGRIGYGGFPSNHSAIASSVAALVAIREGIQHPAFGVAVAFAFIVMLDAHSLRRQIGRHAELLNMINRDDPRMHVRERIGQTRLELAGGVAVGIFCAWLISQQLERFT